MSVATNLHLQDNVAHIVGATLAQVDYFETAPTIAVAVSGGADSMALMLLAKHWTDTFGGKVVALTVDHKLRSEAKEEVAFVGRVC